MKSRGRASDWNVALLLILLLGFVLMVWGIWVRNPHVMGPDEKTAVTKALWLGVELTPFIPDFNKGGNFYLYFLAATFAPYYLYLKITGQTAGLANQASRATSYFDAPQELRQVFLDFLLVGRFASVLVGLLSIYLTYDIARDLYSKRAGIVAAGSLAIGMGFVNTAHYATEDALLTFAIILTFSLFTKYYLYDDDRYLFAGAILAGLSVSTKATAGFLIFPLVYLVVADHLPSVLEGDRQALKAVTYGLLVNGSLALGAYLLTTPSVFVFPELFINDLLGESARAYESGAYISTPSWVVQATSLARAFGLPLFFLAMAGLGYSLYCLTNGRNQRIERAVLLFVIPYYLVIGSWKSTEVWYAVPLMPLFGVLIGHLVDKSLKTSVRKAVIIVLAAVFVFTAFYTGITVQQIGTDARVDSTAWVEENFEADATVDVYQYALHLPRFPPDVTVNNYWFNSSSERDWSIATDRVRCRVPDFIIISSAHYTEFVLNPGVHPEISDFYDRLFAEEYGYKRVATFGPPPKRPYSFADQIELTVIPRTITNHDLQIVVFERKGTPKSDC